MNCLDCVYHRIIPDHDPWNDACIDDQAVVCILQPNDKEDIESLDVIKSSPYKIVVIGIRLYNTREKCDTPDWCPVGHTGDGK